jgi:hypothetical protein
MSESFTVSKKALEALERDLERAQERLDEAQYEADDLYRQVELMRSILNDLDGEKWQIVAINVTPRMMEIAASLRGKSWAELRDLNAEYERLALEHAVYAPTEQVAA